LHVDKFVFHPGFEHSGIDLVLDHDHQDRRRETDHGTLKSNAGGAGHRCEKRVSTGRGGNDREGKYIADDRPEQPKERNHYCEDFDVFPAVPELVGRPYHLGKDLGAEVFR